MSLDYCKTKISYHTKLYIYTIYLSLQSTDKLMPKPITLQLEKGPILYMGFLYLQHTPFTYIKVFLFWSAVFGYGICVPSAVNSRMARAPITLPQRTVAHRAVQGVQALNVPMYSAEQPQKTDRRPINLHVRGQECCLPQLRLTVHSVHQMGKKWHNSWKMAIKKWEMARKEELEWVGLEEE